jgi:glucose/arabinose dehydrogenase
MAHDLLPRSAMPRTFLALAVFAAALSVRAATLPAGFSENQIATGLTDATAMAIAPDGRIFVCMQNGQLRVVKNNVLLPTPFTSITTTSTGERGLLGVALDLAFLANQYVYVYYTVPTAPIHNRVSRFTANGDVAVAGSELILVELDNLSSATNHNGGAVHFGLDGKLYVAVGENALASNAQTLGNRHGKMLRYNSDGTIPTDNPFYNTATGANRSIWALGLRNPFTFAIHRLSGRMHINDVGQSTWEEVNVGTAGANYGWPNSEGPTSVPGHTGPLHYYANDGSTCSIAGGIFYAPEVRQFPSAYTDSYFFGELCGGWIRRLDQGTASASTDFATGITGNPLDVKVGHDGTLYYLTHNGALWRVRWTQHLEGDVNNDGIVNGADMFYLANYLHANGPAPLQGGDVDNNGTINTADLTYLATYLYGRGPTPV